MMLNEVVFGKLISYSGNAWQWELKFGKFHESSVISQTQILAYSWYPMVEVYPFVKLFLPITFNSVISYTSTLSAIHTVMGLLSVSILIE